MKRGSNKVILFLIFAAIALTVFISVAGVAVGDYTVEPISKAIKLGLDIEGGVVVVYEAQTDETGTDLLKTMNQVKGVMTNRIDEFGLTEPNITIQGEKRISIELPGVDNTQEALELIGQTAKLEFLRVTEDVDGNLMPVFAGMTKEMFTFEDVISGIDIKDSFPTQDQYGKPSVGLELNDSGTEAFFEATKKGGQIAIVLDGRVISAPSANPDKPIASGDAIITGDFTLEEASSLASLIRGGALPVEMQEIQTNVIGPTLGIDAMHKAISAAKVGLLLVGLFLMAYYKLPGIISTVSLLLYAALILIIMAGFGATLTLPGIAGLVLSLGMAVDANVIIFERIKEELSNGKTVRSSINFGFKRAMTTILDANVTTFIAGVVLFNFGQGPIKGFAVTLMIGIVVSMFTAIVVTKASLINGLAFEGFNSKKLYNSQMVNFKMDIAHKYKKWFVISALVIFIGLGFSLVNGFNLGIDFTGGTEIQLDLGEKVELDEIRAELKQFDLSEEIIHAGELSEEILIRTKKSLSNSERMEVSSVFIDKYNAEFLGATQFSPSIGDEIKSKALIALLLSGVGMLVYITIRFEFLYGISAIIALLHDVLVLLAVYAVFQIPVNSSFIAAVLTIVGYSINDTIVVFDRIRENARRMKNKDNFDIASISIDQTVLRSIFTSLTTLLVIGSLFVFGTLEVKKFATPLLAGVLAGTYSSIFIASPVWAILKSNAANK